MVGCQGVGTSTWSFRPVCFPPPPYQHLCHDHCSCLQTWVTSLVGGCQGVGTSTWSSNQCVFHLLIHINIFAMIIVHTYKPEWQAWWGEVRGWDIIIETKVVISSSSTSPSFSGSLIILKKTWVTSLVGGGQGVGTSREESRVRDPRGLLGEPVVSQDFEKGRLWLTRARKWQITILNVTKENFMFGTLRRCWNDVGRGWERGG